MADAVRSGQSVFAIRSQLDLVIINDLIERNRHWTKF